MQKDNIEVYNAIMGLIKIKYNTFNFDSFERVMNIYGTLIAVSVNTKSRRIITNNFRHDSVPSIQSSFLPGCIVIEVVLVVVVVARVGVVVLAEIVKTNSEL